MSTGTPGALLRCRRVLGFGTGLSGDAIWWEHGIVRLVGRAADLERRVPSRVPRLELPDALVTPGFVDGHTHFAMWAEGRLRVQLHGSATRAEALRRVQGAVVEQGWLRGQGWDANRWEAPPDRGALDAVTTVPAFLQSVDVHAAWVNSLALQRAGIDRGTPDPPGGRIVRDGSGEPTGLLLERAQELIAAVLPSAEPDRLLRAVGDAQTEAHRMGITGIHDVEGPDALRAFRALESRDALRLRVLFHPPVARLPLMIAEGATSGSGTAWLRLGGVKLFLDGTLGSRTAWMLEPYEDGRDAGMPLATEAEARQAVEAAARAGIACTVHAIGDAAVRLALNLLEPLPRAAVPHRIEHLQCVHPSDLARAAKAGIVASMQPAHLPGDALLADERWGDRARHAYALRSLAAAGTVLAFGSDVPVASLDPRPGVAAAMDREASGGALRGAFYAEERLPFEVVIQGFTVGNAIASGTSERTGRLAPGFVADLVAWDVDPAAELGSGHAFADARVRLTVVDGEIVFAA